MSSSSSLRLRSSTVAAMLLFMSAGIDAQFWEWQWRWAVHCSNTGWAQCTSELAACRSTCTKWRGCRLGCQQSILHPSSSQGVWEPFYPKNDSAYLEDMLRIGLFVAEDSGFRWNRSRENNDAFENLGHQRPMRRAGLLTGLQFKRGVDQSVRFDVGAFDVDWGMDLGFELADYADEQVREQAILESGWSYHHAYAVASISTWTGEASGRRHAEGAEPMQFLEDWAVASKLAPNDTVELRWKNDEMRFVHGNTTQLMFTAASMPESFELAGWGCCHPDEHYVYLKHEILH